MRFITIIIGKSRYAKTAYRDYLGPRNSRSEGAGVSVYLYYAHEARGGHEHGGKRRCGGGGGGYSTNSTETLEGINIMTIYYQVLQGQLFGYTVILIIITFTARK